MRLSDLQTGEKGIIIKVIGHGAFRKRIIEMGFVSGKVVDVILNAPLKDPIKYKIMDYEVSLRRSEASMIDIMTEQEAEELQKEISFHGTHSEDVFHQVAKTQNKTINVALIGNPNCGKTSFFNIASGAREHVGNYSGVTVNAKKGKFNYGGYVFNIVDLPGTYSLSAYTPEEIYVRRHLLKETPDVVINVVASSNIERNLYLSMQLIDMDMSMVIALNMYDELEKSGANLDFHHLGKMIGVPMIPTVSKTGKGIDNLFDAVIRVYEQKDPIVRHIHVNHGPDIEESIEKLRRKIESDEIPHLTFSSRYLAIKMLEGDHEVEKLLNKQPQFKQWVELRNNESSRINKILREDPESAITNAKYGFIAGALKETYHPGINEESETTRIIDMFVTHKFFGFPIFFLILWVMFESTFRFGAYPMAWIESGVNLLSSFVAELLEEGPLKDLIVDGIIGGVGGVIVFLPNIMILYFFISFMEDSGYMARAAFIMDKIMHKMGLHGKSFIPLIMGFGCNVPAILSSRTIEDHNSRMITMLINPLMSCSARLPIYLLLVGTFFPDNPTLVLMGLYAFGVLLAVVMARVLRKHLFNGDDTPFVMELPPYRMPTLKSTTRHMWNKGQAYLSKMGGVILIASILIWFMGYYPRNAGNPEYYAQERHRIETEYAAKINQSGDDSVKTLLTAEKNQTLRELNAVAATEHQKDSYIGQIGQFFEPVFSPLGFNWKINAALLSGVSAKEVIVSTLGVLYTTEDPENEASLAMKLATPDAITNKPDFDPVISLSFMVFTLLYFPCIASISAIINESGSWKWGVFVMIYTTALAWVSSFVVYNVLRIFIH